MPSPLAPPSPLMNDLNPRRADTPRPGAEAAGAGLLEELRASLPVLPILATQLSEVARQVEDSVVQVCGSFQGMAQRARQAVAQGALLQGGSEPGSVANDEGIEGLACGTRATLGSLLQRIEQTCELSNATVQRMQAMERQMGTLTRTLEDIDEVARNAHLLALNGQLEAARAGSHGAAFAVVARETSKMAEHALDASKKMGSLIGSVASSIGGVSGDLRERAAADNQEASRSREEVHRMLSAMEALHREMQQAIAASRENNEALARDIAAAVMALQFQDTVNQRIGHVAQTLRDVHAALQKHVKNAPAAADAIRPAGPSDWAGRMARHYTMASERAVLAAHTASSSAGSGELGDNVELF